MGVGGLTEAWFKGRRETPAPPLQNIIISNQAIVDQFKKKVNFSCRAHLYPAITMNYYDVDRKYSLLIFWAHEHSRKA